MPSNDKLYEILGVAPTATDVEIRQAYRLSALTRHPDKAVANGQSEEEAHQAFVELHHAYETLKDSKTRADYDQTGQAPLFDDVRKKSGRKKKSGRNKKDEGRAMASFENIWREPESQIDKQISILLSHWSDPTRKLLAPRDCLRTGTDDYFLNLKQLYDDYRLTHPSTSSKATGPYRAASSAILEVAEKHFGKANAKRLEDWNTTAPLDPVINGEYLDKDGEYQPAPAGSVVPSPIWKTQLEGIHMSFTREFTKLLTSERGHEKVLVTALSQQHADLYKTLIKDVKSTRNTASPSDQRAIEALPDQINWAAIQQGLATIRNAVDSKQSFTDIQVSKLDWQNLVKTYSLPGQWQTLVDQILITRSGVKYEAHVCNLKREEEQAKRRKQATIEEDGTEKQAHVENNTTSDMEIDPVPVDGNHDDEVQQANTDNPDILPDDSIMVEDGDALREVIAWKKSGSCFQLFLRMNSEDNEVMVCHIVDAKIYRRTLKQAQKDSDLDFSNMRAPKEFMMDKDFSDLNMYAIAITRRGFTVPMGGFNCLPPIYLLFRDDDGSIKACTRSEAGGIFGKDAIDEIIDKHARTERKLALRGAPMRRPLAIKWMEHAYPDSDSEAGSDADFMEQPTRFIDPTLQTSPKVKKQSTKNAGSSKNSGPAPSNEKKLPKPLSSALKSGDEAQLKKTLVQRVQQMSLEELHGACAQYGVTSS